MLPWRIFRWAHYGVVEAVWFSRKNRSFWSQIDLLASSNCFTNLLLASSKGFPDGLVVKNLPAVQEMWDQSLVWEKSLGEGNGNLLQYSCLGNSMNRGAWQQRSLTGCSPWGCKRVGYDLVSVQQQSLEQTQLSLCFFIWKMKTKIIHFVGTVRVRDNPCKTRGTSWYSRNDVDDD